MIGILSLRCECSVGVFDASPQGSLLFSDQLFCVCLFKQWLLNDEFGFHFRKLAFLVSFIYFSSANQIDE